jgi:hypothetical protein
LDVLSHCVLQLLATVFAAGYEIELIALLSSGRRIWSCYSHLNCFTSTHELDVYPFALNVRKIHIYWSLRPKPKMLVAR